MLKLNIMIVCTGNTCRSPMAERLLKEAIEKSGKDIRGYNVCSVGLSTMNGMKASDNSIKVLEEYGIDLSDHKSTVVTKELIEKSDLILTMTKSHKNFLIQSIPKYAQKVYTLKEFAGLGEGDISDPFGGDVDVYRKAFNEIKESVNRIVEKI